MKVPHQLRCTSCDADVAVAVYTHEHRVDFDCPACRHRVQGSLDASFTIGQRIYDRAYHEHKNEKDHTLMDSVTSAGVRVRVLTSSRSRRDGRSSIASSASGSFHDAPLPAREEHQEDRHGAGGG